MHPLVTQGSKLFGRPLLTPREILWALNRLPNEEIRMNGNLVREFKEIPEACMCCASTEKYDYFFSLDGEFKGCLPNEVPLSVAREGED